MVSAISFTIIIVVINTFFIYVFKQVFIEQLALLVKQDKVLTLKKFPFLWIRQIEK